MIVTLQTQGLRPLEQAQTFLVGAISRSEAGKRLNQVRSKLFHDIETAQSPAA